MKISHTSRTIHLLKSLVPLGLCYGSVCMDTHRYLELLVGNSEK
jgi:hypothetical protein